MEIPVRQRWRITFAKDRALRYISHLDLHRTWERVFRRAGIQVAYSRGFNPQPRIQLASALPLGYVGSAEVLDVILEEAIESETLVSRLQSVAPVGLRILDAQTVPLQAPALQAQLRQAEYRVQVSTVLPCEEIARRIADFLSIPHFTHMRTRQRRRETIDLRPLVDDLRLEHCDDGEAVLWMRLSLSAQRSVRPETVLEALGLAGTPPHIERTRLIFQKD
ncbi:MAG: TIGR03936 family radical SAM-associated protein [Anaerolineae bacterium]|nr:TIGR03936 family radical SAM-associated protein [Anaerolineae bacterium]